jgi:hypothetical protein
VFLINLPIAILAFAAALPLLRQTHGINRPKLDLVGVILSASALTAFVLPLIEGRERGWRWWSIAMLLTTPLFVEAFRRYELRLAKAGGDPLVAIEVFRTRGLLRGLAAILTLYAMAAFFLTYSIYLQAGLGCTALEAGLAILPFSIGFLIGSSASPMIGRWAGIAAPSVGFALSSAGLITLSYGVAHTPAGLTPSLAPLCTALPLIGLGMGVSIPTMVRVIVEQVEPHRAGLVGGIVNSTLQVSAAIGVALLGGVFYAVLGQRTDPHAVAHAFSVTLLLIAACHIVGGCLAAGLGQRRPSKAVAAQAGSALGARPAPNCGRA